MVATKLYIAVATHFMVSNELFSVSVRALELNASLQGTLTGNGFHRTLKYVGETTMPVATESCRIVIQQLISDNLYVDLDEVKNKERFNGPKIIADHLFDTEAPSFESEAQTVMIYPSHFKHQRSSLLFNLSLSIHVRYQLPTENGSRAIVELAAPIVYLNCEEDLQGSETIIAPCFGQWQNNCRWMLIKKMNMESHGFSFEVPTGDKNNTFPVVVITLSIAIFSSLFITIKTLVNL